ncbi:MAG: hypothetical protein Terrestrivirus13_1, partial [Terrestrivirus sp.]
MDSFDIKASRESSYNNLKKEKKKRQNMPVHSSELDYEDEYIKGQKISLYQPTTGRNFTVTRSQTYCNGEYLPLISLMTEHRGLR